MSVSKHLYLNRLVFSSLAGTLQTKVISNQNNGHCCRVPGRYVSNEAKKKFRDVFVRDLASVCFLVASPSKVCAILETWRVERTAFPFRVTSLLTHSCRVVKNSGGKRFTKLWHQGTRIFAYLQCNKMVMISLYFFISIYILRYVYIYIYIYISSYIIYIYIYHILLCGTFSTTSTPQLARPPQNETSHLRKAFLWGIKTPLGEERLLYLWQCGHGWRISFQDGFFRIVIGWHPHKPTAMKI